MQTLQRTNKVPFSWVATYEFDDAHPSLKEINAQRLAQRKAERQKALQQRRKRRQEKLRERQIERDRIQIERERRRDAAKNLLGLVHWKWVNPVNIGPT